MMSVPDFSYAVPGDGMAMPFTVSILADCGDVREDLLADAENSGLIVRECGPVSALLDSGAEPAGEIVLVDCQAPDGGIIPALIQLDMFAARTGAHLIVSTSAELLDDVFACCDQSCPQILVDPTPADRLLALGRVRARGPGRRVRELNQEDRLTLLRLTEQVGEIARRLDRLNTDAEGGQAGSAFRFESPVQGYNAPRDEGEARLTRPLRQSLPDPRLIRRIIRQRQLRARFFDGELFADPAWDILLDLTAARAEHARVSVTSACIASGVPLTTALRWISQMTDAGLIQRVRDDGDKRRAFVALSDSAAGAMARYFAEAGELAQAP